MEVTINLLYKLHTGRSYKNDNNAIINTNPRKTNKKTTTKNNNLTEDRVVHEFEEVLLESSLGLLSHFGVELNVGFHESLLLEL